MSTEKHKLDHVGWITQDVELFESFWVEILGFELVNESVLTPKMASYLFKTSPALIRRYSHSGWDIDIEIHQFEYKQPSTHQFPFQTKGINHICIHTGGPGSRQKFLDDLPGGVKRHVFDNPKGWQNIFIRDFEANWVELRENL